MATIADKAPRAVCIEALDVVNAHMLRIAQMLLIAETSTEVGELCERLNNIDNGRLVLAQMAGLYGETYGT